MSVAHVVSVFATSHESCAFNPRYGLGVLIRYSIIQNHECFDLLRLHIPSAAAVAHQGWGRADPGFFLYTFLFGRLGLLRLRLLQPSGRIPYNALTFFDKSL